jgi:hypothetical protein
VDRALTPGDVEQAEDRCNRIGQSKLVKALWLRAFEVCTVVDAMIEKKQKKIDSVLGEESANNGQDGTGAGVSASAVLDQLFSKQPKATLHRSKEAQPQPSTTALVSPATRPLFAQRVARNSTLKPSSKQSSSASVAARVQSLVEQDSTSESPPKRVQVPVYTLLEDESESEGDISLANTSIASESESESDISLANTSIVATSTTYQLENGPEPMASMSPEQFTSVRSLRAEMGRSMTPGIPSHDGIQGVFDNCLMSADKGCEPFEAQISCLQYSPSYDRGRQTELASPVPATTTYRDSVAELSDDSSMDEEEAEIYRLSCRLPARAPTAAAIVSTEIMSESEERTLTEMGFSLPQARDALCQHPGNIEGALMFLLNKATALKEMQAKDMRGLGTTSMDQAPTPPRTGGLPPRPTWVSSDEHECKATSALVPIVSTAPFQGSKALHGPRLLPHSPSVLASPPGQGGRNRPCLRTVACEGGTKGKEVKTKVETKTAPYLPKWV